MYKKNNSYLTKVSNYGFGDIDVRDSYKGLPLQFFWTWLTGKALPNGNLPLKASETLLTTTQMILQLIWSWGVIVLSIYCSVIANNIFISIIALIFIVNRTRGLLHTFHYTQHGAGIKNKKLALFLCEYFMSIPILHLTLKEYARIHNKEHHGKFTMCTKDDPDQQFMMAHKFKANMSHSEFWLKLIFSPFHPMRIIDHISFRLKHNFVHPTKRQILVRIIFWTIVFSIVSFYNFWFYFVLYYLFPLLFLTQISSYLQHVTEHLWFPLKKPEHVRKKEYYASLTWGRFLGRPFPSKSIYPNSILIFKYLEWIFKTICIDLFIRLFSYMQDMSCHDYHHRRPGVNFWAIEQERANDELVLSDHGPMTETWSWLESVYILRDHLVFNESDPFSLYGLKESKHNTNCSTVCKEKCNSRACENKKNKNQLNNIY